MNNSQPKAHRLVNYFVAVNTGVSGNNVAVFSLNDANREQEILKGHSGYFSLTKSDVNGRINRLESSKFMRKDVVETKLPELYKAREAFSEQPSAQYA